MSMLRERGEALDMIPSSTSAPTISGPPVSRWWGPFPELLRDTLGYLLHCQSYGDVVKLPMGHIIGLLLGNRDAALYVLNHPADVKHVLVTNQDNYRKAPVPPVESRLFGQGVLHTEGDTHNHQRRLFLPFFHGNHVTAYTELITSKADELMTRWQDGMTVNIGHEMAQLTLSTIARLLFGRDLGSESNTALKVFDVGQDLIKLQYDSLLASLTPLWLPTPRHRRFNRAFHALETMIHRMIEERRASPHEQKNDVLSLLLGAKDAAGRSLSDTEIRDELWTFLFAGHETTGSALTWTWFLLSQCRPVRERLTRELHDVLGDRLPTAADLPRLRYTKMVWDESVRLYPPAYTLHNRVAQSEDRLPSGAVLPPKAWVWVNPWSLHRNARWFPNPNQFDPERFSDEGKRTHTPYSYLPFGAGGRRCPGESFAELEGLLILATIASKVHLRLVDGQTIQPAPFMTLRPNVPVQMIVQRFAIAEPRPILV